MAERRGDYGCEYCRQRFMWKKDMELHKLVGLERRGCSADRVKREKPKEKYPVRMRTRQEEFDF